MSPLEKRANERAREYNATKFGSKIDFKAGFKDFKDQPEVKVILKALEFYSKGHHFDWCGNDDFAPENPSGEPINFESGGAEGSEFNLENGGEFRKFQSEEN